MIEMAEKVKKDENRSFVKRFNLIPKLVCLFFAFIIWIYVMEVDSPDYETTFEDVPVTLVGTSDLDGKNLSVFSGQDALIDVNVKGQKSVISKNSVDDIKVTADVSKITDAGSYDVDLIFDMPSGLTFTSASVNEVKLYIDKKTSVNLELKVNPVNYQVPSGYELGDMTCEIDTVTVTGAQTALKDLSYAQVEVNFAGKNLTESITTDGNITLYDTSDNVMESKYIKLSQNTAKVTVPVYTTKEVKLTADTKYGFYNSNNSEITVSPATMKIKGDAATLAKIETLPVTVLDEKNISESTTMKVDVSLPDGVYAVSGETNTVEVSVKLKNMTRRSMTIKDIQVVNADVNYEIQVKMVVLDLIGETDAIKALSTDNVKVTVDLGAYESGNNPGMIYPTAKVTFTKTTGVVYELGAYNVQMLIG